MGVRCSTQKAIDRQANDTTPLLQTKKNTLPYRNIVATVNLDCRLDLKTIALHARNAEYNPKVQFSLHPC